MSLLASLRGSYADLSRVGVGFCIARWKRRFRKAPYSVPLSAGMTAYVRPMDSDFASLRQIFRDGEYALDRQPAREHVRAEYHRILASGRVPVIIDAGANIGGASLWFKRQFPEAAIVAVEPDPDTAEILRRNLAPLSGAIVKEAAIGGEPGFVALSQEQYSWAVQTRRHEAGCPIITLREAAEAVANGELFIVKVDIEGFESDLFALNTEWIDDAFVVYIEPHDWMLPGQGTSRSFQAEFGRRDYEVHLKGENLIYIRREARGMPKTAAA